MNAVLRYLHRAAGACLTDGQLLDRFLSRRDEDAFAALLRRHGPMVLGVCRRVLNDAHDAEDAFQATFLVLARKAASLRGRERLGGWLHGVAYRASLKARAALARRRARERAAAARAAREGAAEAPWAELLPLLDQELDRLPEPYRLALVLCALQGRSRKEAARQLGLPEGTLSSRLATGRRLLAERLSRRGVALSGGALAVLLSQGTASANVPAPLVVATSNAAALVAAGRLAAVSVPVALVTRGVLRAMFFTKLKVAVGVLLAVAALGAGGLAYRSAGVQAGQPQAERPRNELEALRRENELLKLNLEVVLEKVRAQEKELRALRGQVKAASNARGPAVADVGDLGAVDLYLKVLGQQHDNAVRQRAAALKALQRVAPDAGQQAEAALRALREAKDDAARRRAVEELDRALGRLRQELQRVQPDNRVPPKQ
jgi:RNA polymerase sigma factor (sigma-70 family)